MGTEKRATWSSRTTFILAAVGSAVGLGNAWRFPGLCAKHGGGAFILVYVVAMLVIGVPLLMMEIAIGRKLRRGAPEALRGINKRLEPVGWAATTNAFVIGIYYAVVFGWVILMAILSFKFGGITGDTTAASNLWAESIKSTGNFTGFDTISTLALVGLIIAWGLIYYCIRNGASSVGKVVKYTVFLPVACLVIMAIKGFTMSNVGTAMDTLFIPDFSALTNATLWIDAVGQVFYSLSVMMAILFAYGSFLSKDSNIAVDSMIIAGADFFTSILSSIVLFTTMYGTGMSIENMSTSGISTAFIIYPAAIVNLSSSGVVNAIFAFVFYFCLCTLAIDSAFSIIEGVSTALADKFRLDRKKTTRTLCLIAGAISVVFVTGAGLAILDVVDNWCNSYNLVLIGVLEAIGVGWCFKTSKVLKEVNKNTKKFKMPAWWFNISIKFIAPIVLTGFFIWNLVTLFTSGGVYGAESGYTLLSNIICGWVVTAFVFSSGFIVKIVVNKKKKNGFVENEVVWTDDEEDLAEDVAIEAAADITKEGVEVSIAEAQTENLEKEQDVEEKEI